MTRTEFLRDQARKGVHKQARAAMPECWSAVDLPGDISERKAQAMAMLFDQMPLYIGEQELIVGSRTMYGHRNEFLSKSDMNVNVMPHYLNEQDKKNFSGDQGEFFTQTHNTPDFGRILTRGIDGLIRDAEQSLQRQTLPIKQGWLHAVILSYQAVSRWIERYADYAAHLAEQAAQPRKEELERISRSCRRVAHDPPRDFWEAIQLFWFASLATIVENFRWINYGRVDQFLYPWFGTVSAEEAQQLVDCLLCKMYDGVDVLAEYFGAQGGELNITLGGVTPEGEDAVNPLTFVFLEGIGRVRFPEPEVSCRISSKNPPEFLQTCAKLSVQGLNFIAYYNDDQFIESMTRVGIPLADARNYAFDLCQDITIPGRSMFYCSTSINLAQMLLEAMKKLDDASTYEDLVSAYKQTIAADLRTNITAYNACEAQLRAYADGDPEPLYRQLATGRCVPWVTYPAMSPLPIVSALYDNCLETATDLSWCGYALPDRGVMIMSPVVGVNGLAALHKRVYEEKRYTLTQVRDACDHNFEGQEAMRRLLWTAPKWGNDDDYVDLPGKEIMEFTCDEVLKYRTPTGGRHLAGIHQPHPVQDGHWLGATPEGRKAREPVPVTLTPENGTMKNGPTAAFRSAAKIDPMKYQWNFCLMLQYFASVFQANEGPDLFAQLVQDYFKLGGGQHQPNIVNIEDLRRAQTHPQDYQDLIIRMWGVSAHFVDLPRELQDEVIARFEQF